MSAGWIAFLIIMSYMIFICLLVYAKVLPELKGRVSIQTTWRPSEAQMKALKDACDEHWEPDGLDPLYTLYQDLKKIR